MRTLSDLEISQVAGGSDCTNWEQRADTMDQQSSNSAVIAAASALAGMAGGPVGAAVGGAIAAVFAFNAANKSAQSRALRQSCGAGA